LSPRSSFDRLRMSEGRIPSWRLTFDEYIPRLAEGSGRRREGPSHCVGALARVGWA